MGQPDRPWWTAIVGDGRRASESETLKRALSSSRRNLDTRGGPRLGHRPVRTGELIAGLSGAGGWRPAYPSDEGPSSPANDTARTSPFAGDDRRGHVILPKHGGVAAVRRRHHHRAGRRARRPADRSTVREVPQRPRHGDEQPIRGAVAIVLSCCAPPRGRRDRHRRRHGDAGRDLGDEAAAVRLPEAHGLADGRASGLHRPVRRHARHHDAPRCSTS